MESARNTDGTDRAAYRLSSPDLTGFEALESDPDVLFGRLTELSRGIRYYNKDNRPDGYLDELWSGQYLTVWNEIGRTDPDELEKRFLEDRNRTGRQQVIRELAGKLRTWYDRLELYIRIHRITDRKGFEAPATKAAAALAAELKSLLEEADEATHRQPAKNQESTAGKASLHDRIFYLYLLGIRRIGSKKAYYRQALEQIGNLDPSLAILAVFTGHYARIAATFNKRWEALPGFYADRILGSAREPGRPDRMWLRLTKNPGEQTIRVPAATGFVAAENPDGSRLCYYTERELPVSDMRLVHLVSVYAEHDPFRQPAARLEEARSKRTYVTAILQKELQPVSKFPQDLFGRRSGRVRPVPVGLMVESPLLLLREGRREGSLYLHLTPESVAGMQNLLRQARQEPATLQETAHKLLQDAFFLKISTETGWETLPGYLRYEPTERSLVQTFRMDEDFPSTVPCEETLHRMTTAAPALQLVMNRDAWLFPYSWAAAIRIDRFTLRVKAEDVSIRTVSNESGPVDVSAPFYPFGTEARQDSWMVFGNYEMSLKPLRKVVLNFQWQQLPENKNGFAGHYRNYGLPIDNDSFRVRVEWLDSRKWTVADTNLRLFRSERPDAPVDETNSLTFNRHGLIPAAPGKEEEYEYGRARDGFFRLVLESPETGFGHALYRTLFARIMLKNSRSKKEIPLPAEPVTPVIGDLRADYEAEDEYLPEQSADRNMRIYHIRPLIETEIFPVEPGQPVPLVAYTESETILKLGFADAAGCDSLCFYADLAPRTDRWIPGTADPAPPVIAWSFLDSDRWVTLDPAQVTADTTHQFTRSGIVELTLPKPATASMTDRNGCFWLKATFDGDIADCQWLRGIYLHTAEAVAKGGDGAPLPAGTITEPENPLPDITGIEQLFDGNGGRPPETGPDRYIRIADRIAHRNRAVTPHDYERIVLAAFPQVGKVKCFPAAGCPAQKEAGATVTLAVVQPQPAGSYPICSHPLRREIADYLRPLLPATVGVEVVNPAYEEITVRCHVRLHPEAPIAATTERLKKKFDGYIAPWLDRGAMPVFGYTLSLEAFYTILANDPGIEQVLGLSVLHVARQNAYTYELTEYADDREKEVDVGLSYPWSIPVASDKHLIACTYEKKEPATGPVGIDELTIGNTFIIE